MVCIAFVVTLAHLVVLATLSPVGANPANRLSISEGDPMEELGIESFPAVNDIPPTATSEQSLEEPEIGESEPDAVSIPRDKRIETPKPADLAEATPRESQAPTGEERPPDESGGPHEIRQIVPKPRS